MRILIAVLSCLATTSCANTAPQSEAPSVYKVYFLGGQSNMEGFGYNSDLPENLQAGDETVRIFHGKTVADGEDGGGVGMWGPLEPGHGFLFDTEGTQNKLSDRFGPELSFAAGLNQSDQNEKVAIIKFVRGGTGLIDGVSGYGSWDPDYQGDNGRNQYDNALTTIANAMSVSDIDGDGRDDVLIPAAIIWMQGEADAFDNLPAATNYEANLGRLMDLLRASLRDNDLPVVIGRIQDSGSTPETQVMSYSSVVQQAQADYAANNPCAEIVTVTQNFGFLPDGWHYLSANYVELDAAFAEKANALQLSCPIGD